MYMSYCRFEGTRAELNACMDVVQEHYNEEAEYEVSDREITEFKKMIYEVVDFLQNTEIIDDEGEIDNEQLDRVCEMMGQAYEEF